ncbi:hypothetical protein [Anaerotignum sp.]
MSRNTSARSLLQSKISNSKGAYNSRTGKLKEDEEEYIPKKQAAKAAEKSAPSLRSQGQPVEVVKDTGMGTALRELMEQQRRTQAIRKEMNAIGKELRESGSTDFAAYQAAAQKQAELQKQLPGASFVAGFLNSMGGDLAKIVANASGNEALQKNWGNTLNQMQETQEANKGAGMAGVLTGELAKAGAGYMTIGKAAEKAALAGAGRLAGGKALSKGGTLATRMLGQQAADTAVNTPITIAAGLADDKTKEEIAKDVGKQMALDAAFNIGLEGLGAGARALQGMRTAKKEKTAAETVAEMAEKAKKAPETAVPETISQKKAEKATAKTAGKTLIPEEELPETLLQEYRNLTDPEWVHGYLSENFHPMETAPEIYSAELKKLDDRRIVLEEMLGKTTKRETDTERRINSEAIRELKKLLSLSGKEQNAETEKLLRMATMEGRTGRISKETRDKIFNGLFNIGGVSNKADIDKELKDHLRSLKLKISAQDASNIPDFNQWRKGTFGKIGSVGVDHRGNIDTAWLELNEKWPHIFPDNITNPADQLEHIKAVADDLKYREIPLAETVDAEGKAEMRATFDAHMDDLETAMYKLTKYTNDRVERQLRGLALEGVPMDYSTFSTADMKWLYDQRYGLEKEAQRVRRTRNLREGDKLALRKLLLGEISEAEARKNAGIYASDLMDIYHADAPLHKLNQTIQGYKKYANEQQYKDIGDIVGDLPIRNGEKNGWRDLAPLRMARETQERILDMIAPTKEQAKQLKEYLFDPIHANERDRTLFKNDFIDRLKNLKISTKNDIDLTIPGKGAVKTSESGLVQWLGEKRYQLRKMESMRRQPTMQEIDEMNTLRQEIKGAELAVSKEQLKKIDAAILEMQEIYKEIHPKINEALIRNGYEPVGYIEGYFPHMSFDDPNNIIDAAAQKLGFDFASKELPMDIAGRTETFRPGKKWAGNLLTREGKETDYDALRAFDLYIDNISDVIYHTDDIKRLRAYEDYMRYTLSDDGIKERVDAVRNNVDLNEAEKASQIDEIYEGVQNHSLQNYVSNIRTYTDLLAGKKHKIDRVLETEMFGRKVYKVVSEIENRVAGNMVAGNIGSALTNFIPITQGMSSMSPKSNLQGLKEALEYMSKGEMDELTKKSAFLTTREGSDLLYKTGMRKISDAAGKPMEWADKFSTQAVWRSRYYDNMAKGMTEDAAIKNADQFARNLFAGRSKGAMPTAFSAKALKPLTMFQLEVNNQISYLMKDLPKETGKDVRKIMQAYGGIIIGAYIYNDVYEKMTGRRSALDPFGIANEAIGDLSGRQVRNTLDILGDALTGDGVQITEKTEKKKGAEVYSGLKENITENIPFIGGWMGGGRIPISSALPDLDAIGEANANYATGDITKERKDQIVRKELGKSLAYMALPVAGGQIKKTLQGMETMAKGGSYSQTNDGAELQFPVDQESPAQWAKAGLFGKWATEGGKGYLEKDQSLGTNQTQTYEKLVAAGAKNTAAFEAINRVRRETKAKEQRSAIRSSLLTDEQKAILFYDFSASDRDKEILDYFDGKTSMAAAADCISRINDYDGTSPKRNVLRNSDLSDENKEYIYLQKIVQKDSREKEQAKIVALRQAGVGMDDYLKIKNKYAQVDDGDMKTKEKAADMSQWLIEEGFTWQQQAAIKEQFAFWGMYKQNYK